MKSMLVWIGFVVVFSGCVPLLNNTSPARETVMSPGMKICAEDRGARICIVAGENYKRTITLNGKTYSIYLTPRKERWHGALGLYTPKALCKDDDGTVMMAVVEESQVHYKTLEDLLRVIAKSNHSREDWEDFDVSNDQGIRIRWKKTQISETEYILRLSVLQRLVNGEKPTSLPGSRNDKICISYEGKGGCD